MTEAKRHAVLRLLEGSALFCFGAATYGPRVWAIVGVALIVFGATLAIVRGHDGGHG